MVELPLVLMYCDVEAVVAGIEEARGEFGLSVVRT